MRWDEHISAAQRQALGWPLRSRACHRHYFLSVCLWYQGAMALRAFISYSHRDEEMRRELETHFALLKRQRLVTIWHDRRIGPGQDFSHEIDAQLEAADLILFLVSASFLASDYCYEIEMRRALERHERDECRVVPIILDHCDWHSAPFGRLNALPTDGRPVTDFPNRNQGLAEIARALRRVAEEVSQRVQSGEAGPTPGHPRRASPSPALDLRLPRRFTDRDKRRFLVEAFDRLRERFVTGLRTLEQQNADVEVEVEAIHAGKFIAEVYAQGASRNRCKIWRGDGGFAGDIAYVSGSFRIDDDSTMNESFRIDSDGSTLFLKPLGLAIIGRSRSEDAKMEPEEAADYLLEVFVSPLRI